MISARDFAAARAKFPHTKKVVYFNSASFGPFSTAAKKAVNDNVDFRVAGGNDSRIIFETRDKLRGEYARLLHRLLAATRFGAGDRRIISDRPTRTSCEAPCRLRRGSQRS